eukprot:4372312-Prymnesium_polylepis.1
MLILAWPTEERRSTLQNALRSLLGRASQISLRVRPPVHSTSTTSGRHHRARMTADACPPNSTRLSIYCGAQRRV